MIERVELLNFKSLRKVKVDLQPFTLIAGPNSCGKTSLLRAVNLATKYLGAESPSKKRRPPSSDALATHGEREFRVRLYGSFVFGVEAVGVRAVRMAQKRSLWQFERQHKRAAKRTWSGGLPSRLGEGMLRSTFLRLEARRLAEASYGKWPEEFLHDDGSGLPTVLATLAATHSDEFNQLKAALRAVIPQVRDFRLSKAERTTYEDVYSAEEEPYYRKVAKRQTGFGIVLDMQNVPHLAAENVSEGTLLTLGLLTVLYSQERPRLVLLDNLETGLHPRALGELVSQIRRVLARHPELQIIATTHSPYLLDHFSPEEVRLMCSDADGFARCGDLTDHPKFERWKDEMQPGEFWSMIGEDWLRSNKPKKTSRRTAARKR